MRGRSAFLGLILIVVGFILFGALLTAFDSMAYTEVSSSRTISTGVGETTGDITLGNPLYASNLDNVVEISSTLTSDDPAPSSYDEGTDTLTVSGLTASEDRTLTVDYLTEREDDYVDLLRPYLPFFILLIFLAAGGGLVWHSFR